MSKTATAQETDALLRDVVRLFIQAQREMTSCCRGASAKECEALLTIGQGAPITVQEFAARMSLEKTWASRLLTRLENKKFIKRLDHPEDGRSWLVQLTAAGEAERDKLQDSLNAHAANLMRCVPAGQRAGVEQALGHLRDALTKCLATCGGDKGGRC
jgi:DNA-binding MarR family transcriptional regulator